MWKQGGRSSALDRAQALLSGRRSSRGGAESAQGSTAKTRGAVGEGVKTGSAPPNTNTLLSDLSDLSSVSPAPEPGADTVGPAAAAAAAGKTQGTDGDSTKDLGAQSSLSGGGSRFLKKAPPPATNSSQSPVSRSRMQQEPEPRYVSSSQRGSQTAALSRLAQIESRIRSRKQAQEQGPRPAENLATVELSAQSGSDQSLNGKRFLKNKTAVAVNDSYAPAARSPLGPGVGVRSRSGAAGSVAPSKGLETKSVRVVSGVSLESDEEDMKKLLGDSLDSLDNSFFIPGRPSSIRTADKILGQGSHKVLSTPLPAAVPPSPSLSSALPRSPTSPPRRGSPFRFTGQAQARFSPSALSPSPSPPRVSPSPPRGVGSPQRSLSSASGRGEVLSLEELFPVGPGPEDTHSETSAVSSEDGQRDFRINVMTLDDLVPANLGFTPGKERKAKHSVPIPGSSSRHQQLPTWKEKEQQQEDLPDYQSDFESESRMEPDCSASQVSEHLQGHGDGEGVLSEVGEEASDSDAPGGRTEDDYSSTFSDTCRSYVSQTSDRSQTLGRSRDSRSSVSHGSQTWSRRSRRRASTRKVLNEAAVQTQSDPLAYTWPTGMAALGPAVGMAYMHPSSVVAHTLSAEMVEALSSFNPAAFVLNEMLKQQLAMTRRFIESSRHLHSSLVQSLEPPNYRYTTLEDTKEYIRKHRPPTLTMEDALEEVLQEMRDYHHI